MNNITDDDLKKFKARGYSDDLLPKTSDKRTWKALNYFTLWQGSVHNVPNYIAIGGFLSLGLSSFSVIAAIALSGFFIAAIMILNGYAGSKYGVPFSMFLRSSYGVKGAILPGILRGCIVAIMWFGLQNFLGSVALYIVIAKIWPGFVNLGGAATLAGITYPEWIAFILFCLANVGIGVGGGDTIKRFTGILNPCIYIAFIGIAIWAVKVAGLSNILNYVPQSVNTGFSGGSAVFTFLFILNALIAVWAAPAVSSADFTQHAKSFSAQAIGQTLGLVVAYIIFAFSSVCILAGASIYYGTDTWDILEIIKKWDTSFIAALVAIIIAMTTISTNATGNIVPAAYQIISMFRKLSYRQGVIIASIASIAIMPWKLVENKDSIFNFLSIIGGMLGPVIGVMLAHYFVIQRRNLNLDELYIESGTASGGINLRAFAVTIIAIFISLGGKFIPALVSLSQLSFFVGVIVAFGLYWLLDILKPSVRKG